MLPERMFDQRPWLAAPRPFHDEALGSWLGRVAARYRMDVAQLVDDYDLQIPLKTSAVGWLLLPPLHNDVLQRLAGLARMKIDLLKQIQTPANWVRECHVVPYCKKCVFLNPEDVFSPMWKRHWLDPQCVHCSVHHEPLESLPASKVRQCSNFDNVMKMISRKEERRRLLQQLYPHSQ